ncbi:hypothetical protein ACFVH6_22055 [Spirillospora sp. NPDC127200]
MHPSLLAWARSQLGVPYQVSDWPAREAMPARPPEPAQHPVRPERAAWEDEEALTLARLAEETQHRSPWDAALHLFTKEPT